MNDIKTIAENKSKNDQLFPIISLKLEISDLYKLLLNQNYILLFIYRLGRSIIDR